MKCYNPFNFAIFPQGNSILITHKAEHLFSNLVEPVCIKDCPQIIYPVGPDQLPTVLLRQLLRSVLSTPVLSVAQVGSSKFLKTSGEIPQKMYLVSSGSNGE